MICTDVAQWLDDYADGELENEIRQAVEMHLETCLACNRELGEIRSLLDRARRLPVDIAPEAELWPGIESRIGESVEDEARARAADGSSWATRRVRLAAAATIFVALTIPLALFLRQPAGTVQGRPAERSDQELLANRHPDTDSAAMLARVEDGVLLPRTDLLEAVERRRGLLPPEVLSTIEQDALLLDEAIAEVRLALARKPDDRRLQLLLATRYRQEVELLKLVNHV